MKKLLLLLPLLLLSSCSSTLTGFNKDTTINNTSNHTKPYGYTTSTEIVRKGKESQRFEIRHGDCGSSESFNDCEKDRRRYERRVERTPIENYDSVTWYTWSVYLPEDFDNLGRTSTTLGQLKLGGYMQPVWVIVGDRKGLRLKLIATGNRKCNILKYEDLRGKWTDIMIKSDLSTKKKPGKRYAELFINGERYDCNIDSPILTKKILNIVDSRKNKKTKSKVNFQYGIYNSFVSRWLNANKTKDVKVEGFTDYQENSNTLVQSITGSPWDIDWGVKLPTQVVYYDEIRIGPTRESVDINMNEAVD